MAVGIYFFKFANNFTFGGITGIAVLVAKFLPISASDFSFVVNILLLIVSKEKFLSFDFIILPSLMIVSFIMIS